jgi:hypothetical protein
VNFARRFIGTASLRETESVIFVCFGFSRSRQVAKLSVFVLDSLFCKLIAES